MTYDTTTSWRDYVNNHGNPHEWYSIETFPRVEPHYPKYERLIASSYHPDWSPSRLWLYLHTPTGYNTDLRGL